MKKVYLAARYDRRDELREYRKILQEYGIEVTSNWLDEKTSLNSQMGEETEEFYIFTANLDLQDIERADSIMLFSENPLEGFRRGGRHVEYGYALKAGKAIVVIGPKENVFHYLDGIKHVESFERFIKELEIERQEASYFGV